MSTPQTDSHHDFQKRMYQEFCTMVDEFQDGLVSYDAVEEELEEMREDDDIDSHTYMQCEKYWNHAKNEEKFWQEEERRVWSDLKDDSGVY